MKTMKLNDPYMYYEKESDILYIYDGENEVAQLEHPKIDLACLAQSLGCIIDNSVTGHQVRELVKVAPSGICKLSNPVVEVGGLRTIWYRFAGEEYKITDAFTDDDGEFTMFDAGNTDSKMADVIYFTSVKSECYLRDCLIDDGMNND